ncbi:hypothetical protein Patl1_03751 [Pistacia atlantica]|uniref:Uncharacterized protein n=1 Tax=Pistacia atlantica TaxID=434234 RepID=A0ACC1BTF6_9ROSI|nr:hypothetical protein Patl1_03751 [Pistacia atlantica]
MAHAGATFKSTTTKATLRLGQGVEFEMELDAAAMKESLAESILGFIRTSRSALVPVKGCGTRILLHKQGKFPCSVSASSIPDVAFGLKTACIRCLLFIYVPSPSSGVKLLSLDQTWHFFYKISGYSSNLGYLYTLENMCLALSHFSLSVYNNTLTLPHK